MQREVMPYRVRDILTSKWETLPEVSKATGLSPAELGPMVEQFVADGHAEIGTWRVRDCSVPMVRIKPGIVPGKRRRK